MSETANTKLPVVSVPSDEPPGDLAALARQYPAALFAGGLAIGLLAGALIPRTGASRIGKRAMGYAATAGELALALGAAARRGTDSIEPVANAASDARNSALGMVHKAMEFATKRKR